MTATQLKVEIDRELNKLSEKQLEEILDFVKELQSNKKLNQSIDRIINENRELFTKLAQ